MNRGLPLLRISSRTGVWRGPLLEATEKTFAALHKVHIFYRSTRKTGYGWGCWMALMARSG